MIFYFSGTGNSRWVAESLGKRLGDAVEDIADVKIEKEEYTLPEGEILGFVFPVYAWAPPTIVMDFISLLRLSSAPKYVFFVWIVQSTFYLTLTLQVAISNDSLKKRGLVTLLDQYLLKHI